MAVVSSLFFVMLIEFRHSPIHGMGGFAVERIAAGNCIIEYVGRKISKEESLRECARNNPFVFYLDPTEDLDGNVEWNPARLLNHSCCPNSEAKLLDGCVWIVAQRPIVQGEEITFNYGYDLENYREYPCHCGAANCVGFILAEEFHEQIRRTARAGSAGDWVARPLQATEF